MILAPPCAVLRFCVHKSSACQEKKTDFQSAQPKGSLVQRELSPKVTEGLFYEKIFAFTIPPSRYASHLPLHKGGSLPPDSTPKRCNTLYLVSKALKRSTNKIARTPFIVGRGFISRRFLCIYRLFSAAASHRPTRLR